VAFSLAFGRRRLIDPGLEGPGIGLRFTRAAVVLAQTLVAELVAVRVGTRT
jgi:ABC-type sulfate transport system permease component